MSEKMMCVIRYHDYGGPEVLVLDQVPVPTPAASQVLVRVVAVGVNPADWKMRAGMYKSFQSLPMPFTPGLEMSGTVAAIGAGVTGFVPGEAVFGPVPGGSAEYVLAAASDLQPKPANITFVEAASVPVTALTAWGSLIDVAKVQAGQRVLVQGAAGGVGMFGVQLAHWKGAYVIGTASARNADFVRSLGADQVIDYQARPFEEQVKDLDVVFDTVGGEVLERSLKVIRKGGVLVTVAGRFAPEFGKEEGIQVLRGGRGSLAALEQITHLLADGTLKPYVSATFHLSDASKAHEMSQTGHTRGKIVLTL